MSSSITNEKWLIAVPNSSAKGAQSAVAELNQAANQLAQMHAFQIPTLKVGTLDSLMTISEETTKMDTFISGVVGKVKRCYEDMWKESIAAQAGDPSASSSSSSKPDEKIPELRVDGKTAQEYITAWRWNDVRYPTRSALALLIGIIVKDTTKSDEALKKQVAEYNEVRTSFTAIERKDQGSLLVKPIGPFVKSQPIETAHLTTLMLVVPKARQQEFMESYETLEAQAAQREREEAEKKRIEAAERARKEAERAAQLDEKEDGGHGKAKTDAQKAHEAQRAAEKAEELAKAEETKRLEEEMADPAVKAKKEEEARLREEEEKRKNKKLPNGCNAIVPRSAQVLADEAEFILVSVVVLKQGAEQYKNLCREKRYTVRPFKFDPAEDKAERERKVELEKKKKNLWNFLIRWCTNTYTEVFTAWIHLKAIRLYVESVLRYGLPYNAQAILIEPHRGREKQLREVLKNLYSRLAGNNANLTTALDPNEPDLSGLGTDFYSYVYLPLTLGD